MEGMTPVQVLKTMGPEDKAALKSLKEELSAQHGKDVPLGDVMRAVTPGMETPDYLK